jgi:hypothetical protein
MHYCGVPKLRKMDSHQMGRFYSIRPEMMFWSVFEHLKKPSLCKKIQNFCFGSECTISGYRGCKNGFTLNACIQLPWTLNDVWERFGAFCKCSKCEKDAKLVYRAWMHYFRVPKLRNWFRTKCIHCTALDPKWFLQVFWNIRQPSACEKMQYLCFGLECTISGYRCCENGFTPNASIQIPWTNNDVLQCFIAFQKS